MSDLPEMIQGLLKPEAYPVYPRSVELIQTHISYLLLTPDHVYKIKKPVNFGFLDFSTLDKRLYYCDQELLLNRRTSPEVYLDVVEIHRDDRGTYRIGGPGVTVEYAVKMVRLPQDRVASVLLQRGELTEAQVAELGRMIAEFHKRTPTSHEISRYGSQEILRLNANENFEQTAPYIGRTITQKQYDGIREATETFLTEKAALLERRVARGRIRDCHGDLHLGQIFLTDQGVRIIDCIEFNDRFRYSDVAADIAFTAMDFDYYGRPDLSNVLMTSYMVTSGVREVMDVLDYYKMYRAYVRGKVDSFQLDDPHIPEATRQAVQRRAAAYFSLAYRYARRGKDVRLVTVGGLVGTGKSTLATALAGELGAAVLSSDIIRKRLAGLAPTEHQPATFDEGLYTPEMTERTYAEMFRLARGLLKDGYAVVLDATFIQPEHRAAAAALAQEAGVPFASVFCVAPPDIVQARLEARASDPANVSDAGWEVYEAQRQALPQGVPLGEPVRVVDTSEGTPQEQVALALKLIGT